MAITAQMVKELREATGAGMMDAKKALTETDGNMEAAVDWLRTKGLAKAAKKADRVAAEGLIGVAVDNGRGVAVEINSRPERRDRVVTFPLDQEPPVTEPQDDRVERDRPSVLFVCVHNAGRSQMAAGFLEHLSAGQVEVRSAGSMPADQVNPAAVAAMAEVGIDISTQTPKVLTTDAVQASDVVITMGCGDACPIFPGKRYEDWELTDPAGLPLEQVRPIRDEIRGRVEGLLASLAG